MVSLMSRIKTHGIRHGAINVRGVEVNTAALFMADALNGRGDILKPFEENLLL